MAAQLHTLISEHQISRRTLQAVAKIVYEHLHKHSRSKTKAHIEASLTGQSFRLQSRSKLQRPGKLAFWRGWTPKTRKQMLPGYGLYIGRRVSKFLKTKQTFIFPPLQWYFPLGAVLRRFPQLLIFRAGLDQLLMLACCHQFFRDS